MDRSHFPVVIIGGGQAGLSVSYCLKQRDIAHIIFEKHFIAHSWQTKRWDSFCLVTPNWQCALPGYPYAEADPHGFMGRDQIVQYVQNYAQAFDPNIKEGVVVYNVQKNIPNGSQNGNQKTGRKTNQIAVTISAFTSKLR